MTVKLETLDNFVGVIHSRDYRKPECSGYGENTKVTFLRINMLAEKGDPDYCGIFYSQVCEKYEAILIWGISKCLILALRWGTQRPRSRENSQNAWARRWQVLYDYLWQGGIPEHKVRRKPEIKTNSNELSAGIKRALWILNCCATAERSSTSSTGASTRYEPASPIQTVSQSTSNLSANIMNSHEWNFTRTINFRTTNVEKNHFSSARRRQ